MWLVEQLLGADEDVRRSAMLSLRKSGTKARALLSKLVAKLPELEPERARAVLEVLGPLGGGKLEGKAREGVVAALASAQPRVREAALWVLCDFPEADAEVVERITALREDADRGVREAASRVLELFTPGEESGPTATGAQAAALASRDFGGALYRVLREREGNLLFSPLSVFTLLALVLRGTRGGTEAELTRALRWPSEPEALAPALRELSSVLHARESEDTFSLVSANGFWFQEGHPVRPEYLAELASSFGAEPSAMDFAKAPARACEVINGWVRERTRGRIGTLVSEADLGALTRFVLANAVYFKGRWAEPFPVEDTRPSPFHLLDGTEVQVPMMSTEEDFGHASGPGYELVELPYRGGQASLRVVLPDAGLFPRIERLLASGRGEAFLAPLERRELQLRMPRFKLAARVRLPEVAERLGFPSLFGPGADLSGLSPVKEPFAGQLVHQADISVDEQGTEAAAATGFAVAAGLKHFVTVDRPFLFFLRHAATGAVLFQGRVVDPRGGPR